MHLFYYALHSDDSALIVKYMKFTAEYKNVLEFGCIPDLMAVGRSN